MLPGEGGKDGFDGSSKLSNTMPPPPPPPKENFESCNVIYYCHKMAMTWTRNPARKSLAQLYKKDKLKPHLMLIEARTSPETPALGTANTEGSAA